MNFFATASNLPPDVGFPLFGRTHLLWLGGIALGVGAVLLLLRRASPVSLNRAARWCAAACVALVAGFGVFLVGQGALSIDMLPLHLCDMTPYLLLIFSLTAWDWTGQTLYCLCLPGAVAALLFPNWTDFPALSLLSLQGFLLHGLLILGILLQIRRGALKPRLKKVWKAWAFLGCVVPPIYLFNLRFHTNFYFVNGGSPGSPLAWLIAKMGNPGYLLGYAALTLSITSLMYLPFLKKRE